MQPLKYVGRRYPKVLKIYIWMHEAMIYGYLIRTLLEGCLGFIVCSLINIFSIGFDTSGETMGSIVSILLLIVLLSLPLFIYIFLKVNRHRLADHDFHLKYASLYEMLDLKKPYAIYYNCFFVLRRAFIGVLAVCINEYAFFQIQATMFSSVLMFTYISWVKPFETKTLNNLELFNELCILGVCYTHIMLSDFTNSLEVKSNAGWMNMSLVIFNLLTNIAVIVCESAGAAFRKFKRFCAKKTL